MIDGVAMTPEKINLINLININYYKHENDNTAHRFVFILHVCDAKAVWDEVLVFEINRIGTCDTFLYIQQCECDVNERQP